MRDFIDLFCGIGGFRVALEKKGLRCVFSSEIDIHASEAYEKNFGEKPFGDITKIPENSIPNHDILCAGFPCQAFSAAGNCDAFDDNRGRLFYEIIRIAKAKKPLVMILENVKNILTIQKGHVFNTVKKEIENIGYNFYYSLLNCSDFGIPQGRKRVYMVCLRKESQLTYSQPKPSYEKNYLKDILIDDQHCANLVKNRKDIRMKKQETQEKLAPIRVGIINKGQQGERIYSINGHAITLTTDKTGLYLVNGKIRKLHINECKKLMGFPQRHFVSKGYKGYRQIGNAVCVPMVRIIYNSIK